MSYASFPVTEIENPTSDLGVDIVEVEVETNMEDMSGGTEIETFEVTVSDNSGATIETFEVTTETSLDTGITEISIEPIEVDMPSTTTETVTLANSNTLTLTTGYANPELQPDNGNIVYLENRKPIQRDSDQTEDIKLIIEF